VVAYFHWSAASTDLDLDAIFETVDVSEESAGLTHPWERGEKAPAYPGTAYVLLHGISHALMAEIALDCGYPASSLKERVYALSSMRGGGEIDRCGILIYTASAGAQGTLGGLVATAPRFSDILKCALDRLQICSRRRFSFWSASCSSTFEVLAKQCHSFGERARADPESPFDDAHRAARRCHGPRHAAARGHAGTLDAEFILAVAAWRNGQLLSADLDRLGGDGRLHDP
jgi:hypothetical protein